MYCVCCSRKAELFEPSLQLPLWPSGRLVMVTAHSEWLNVPTNESVDFFNQHPAELLTAASNQNLVKVPR